MFREPRLIKMESDGDRDRWLWLMEPILGHIFGKAFVVTARESYDDKTTLVRKSGEAYDEMFAREKLGEEFNMPAGSIWEAFL